MITRAGLLPTDERAQKIWHNSDALVFADHWQEKLAEEDLNKIKKMLGVRWTRDDAEGLHRADEGQTSSSKPAQVIEWPLAAILEPELQDSIKKSFGRKFGIDAPRWAKQAPDDMVELYEQPKDEFLGFVQQYVRPKVVTK